MPSISFSRSGRSGAHGKNDQRVSADVSLSPLADIGDAVEMFREATPTATRSEVLRNILDEDLNGRIGALCHAFPGARGMSLTSAIAALAALDGKTVEEYRDAVLSMHIFGRLHVNDMVDSRQTECQSQNVVIEGQAEVGEARRSASPRM